MKKLIGGGIVNTLTHPLPVFPALSSLCLVLGAYVIAMTMKLMLVWCVQRIYWIWIVVKFLWASRDLTSFLLLIWRRHFFSV